MVEKEYCYALVLLFLAELRFYPFIQTIHMDRNIPFESESSRIVASHLLHICTTCLLCNSWLEISILTLIFFMLIQ